MYLGALQVIERGNADALALASHDLRELMEKIATHVDVDLRAHRETLKHKVREIQQHWQRTLRATRSRKAQAWHGEIDGRLLKLLERLEEFFEWFDAHYPRRRSEVVETLKRLDPSGRILPGPLQDLEFQAWDAMRDFFTKVAHHGPCPSEREFDEWLGALETFLLARVRRPTFQDFDAIDEIIREGEGDAQSRGRG